MYSLNWPYAYGKPRSNAVFKASPEDFEVHEFFNTPFSGEGEHILIKIEKKGLTTEEVVRSVARLINKPSKLISYAGLKDKQAVSTQWLSIHAPGEEISGVGELSAPGFRVLEHTRHNKKLKPGFLAGNRFIIRLHDLTDVDDFRQRLEHLVREGVPNYFGEQRFGREGANLARAEELLVHGRKVKDRFLKGLYYSAARSWLFNLILAERVKDATWNKIILGDVLQLRGSNSIFVACPDDEQLSQRIQDKDIAPASPLAGKSKGKVTGSAAALIESVYSQWQPWVAGLIAQGLDESWRTHCVHVDELHCDINQQKAILSFSLPVGSYATVVLRELVCY